MGVRGGIAAVTEVGLDFNESNHQTLSGFETPYQSTADQFGGDQPAITREEGPAKRLQEGHAGSIGQRMERARENMDGMAMNSTRARV